MAGDLDFDERLAQAVKRIENSDDLAPENKALLLDFKRDRKLNEIKPPTIERDLSALKVQAAHVDQPFDEMEKDAVKDLVEFVHDRYENAYTRSIHKRALRNLFKWFNDGEHPPETSWIDTYVPKHNQSKLPEELLTKEDIRAQANAAYNARDKALIWVLWETGARIGELIDLTVGAIEDRKHGRKIVIDGKTGSRRLPLVESVPYLNQWLNQHPNPTKDAPLWCKIQQGGPDDQLGYRYIREKILRKTMDKAGINKPSNPHHYRHSRASDLATELKEPQLCEWFGWVQGSDVPAKYVHLSGRDIDETYDQLHGLSEPDEDNEEENVRECGRCQELNQSDAKFCSRCGMALEEDLANQIETLEEQAQEQILEVENDAEARVVRAVLRELRENPEEAVDR